MMYNDSRVGNRHIGFDVPSETLAAQKYFSNLRNPDSGNRQATRISRKSFASNFEHDSLPMASSAVISSYPLSRSYTEAFRSGIEPRYDRLTTTTARSTTSNYSARYTSPATVTTARYSYSSSSSSANPISYSSSYTLPATMTTRYSSQAGPMSSITRDKYYKKPFLLQLTLHLRYLGTTAIF